MSFLLERNTLNTMPSRCYLSRITSQPGALCAASTPLVFHLSLLGAQHQRVKLAGSSFTKPLAYKKSQLLSHHELLQSLAEKCGWDHMNHFRNLQKKKKIHQCNKDIHEVLRSQHAGQVATSGLHSPASQLLWATFGVSFAAEQA